MAPPRRTRGGRQPRPRGIMATRCCRRSRRRSTRPRLRGRFRSSRPPDRPRPHRPPLPSPNRQPRRRPRRRLRRSLHRLHTCPFLLVGSVADIVRAIDHRWRTRVCQQESARASAPYLEFRRISARVKRDFLPPDARRPPTIRDRRMGRAAPGMGGAAVTGRIPIRTMGRRPNRNGRSAGRARIFRPAPKAGEPRGARASSSGVAACLGSPAGQGRSMLRPRPRRARRGTRRRRGRIERGLAPAASAPGNGSPRAGNGGYTYRRRRNITTKTRTPASQLRAARSAILGFDRPLAGGRMYAARSAWLRPARSRNPRPDLLPALGRPGDPGRHAFSRGSERTIMPPRRTRGGRQPRPRGIMASRCCRRSRR